VEIRTVLKCFGEFNSYLESFEVPDACWAVVFRQYTSGNRNYPEPDAYLHTDRFLSSSCVFPDVVSMSPVHQGILEIDDCAHTQGDFIEATTEDAMFILWSDSPFAIVLPEAQYSIRNKPELFISRRFEAGVFVDEPFPLIDVLGLFNKEFQRGKQSLLQFLISKSQPAMALPAQP